MFVTAGVFHLPVSASDFGAYMRVSRLNGSLGAGSQLDFVSFPDLNLDVQVQ